MSLNLQDCTQILFGSDDVIVNPNPNEQDSNRNTSAAHGLLGNSPIIDDAYATLPAFTLGLESQLPQVGAHYERPETQIPVSQQASQRCGRSATKSRKDRPSTVSRRTDSQSVSNKRKPTCYNCKLDGSWIQITKRDIFILDVIGSCLHRVSAEAKQGKTAPNIRYLSQQLNQVESILETLGDCKLESTLPDDLWEEMLHAVKNVFHETQSVVELLKERMAEDEHFRSYTQNLHPELRTRKPSIKKRKLETKTRREPSIVTSDESSADFAILGLSISDEKTHNKIPQQDEKLGQDTAQPGTSSNSGPLTAQSNTREPTSYQDLFLTPQIPATEPVASRQRLPQENAPEKNDRINLLIEPNSDGNTANYNTLCPPTSSASAPSQIDSAQDQRKIIEETQDLLPGSFTQVDVLEDSQIIESVTVTPGPWYGQKFSLLPFILNGTMKAEKTITMHRPEKIHQGTLTKTGTIRTMHSCHLSLGSWYRSITGRYLSGIKKSLTFEYEGKDIREIIGGRLVPEPEQEKIPQPKAATQADERQIPLTMNRLQPTPQPEIQLQHQPLPRPQQMQPETQPVPQLQIQTARLQFRTYSQHLLALRSQTQSETQPVPQLQIQTVQNLKHSPTPGSQTQPETQPAPQLKIQPSQKSDTQPISQLNPKPKQINYQSQIPQQNPTIAQSKPILQLVPDEMNNHVRKVLQHTTSEYYPSCQCIDGFDWTKRNAFPKHLLDEVDKW